MLTENYYILRNDFLFRNNIYNQRKRSYSKNGDGIKLVVMTNVFFNNQQHEIKTKWFICVKQIKSSFFSNNENRRFYLQYMQNVKTGIYRKLNF